jgi:hypothetical protein
VARAVALALLTLALGAVPARATEPASVFNAPGQMHANACVHLAGSSAPLRFADTEPTGFDVTNAFSFDPGQCPDGTVRLDLHEAFPSALGALLFHRGGNGYTDDGNVKYGELAATDITGPLPAPVPSSGGRGAPCPLADEPPYEVDVRSITGRMRYKPPPNTGSGFSHYGDPGSDQGDRDDVHYTYLLWSFVDVAGGGHVRILLRPGQIIRACDVAPVTMSSWDADGNVNGQVTARYVETLAGSCPVYGWTVWSHTYTTHAPVAHAVAASSAPLADPVPDPACPTAAAAAPPQAGTGGAKPTAATETLSGTVNPVGATTSYHFDYGTTTAYGAITPARSLFGGDRVNSVSASTGQLQPQTTYHYRLAAASVHGNVFGQDATFTTGTAQEMAGERPVTLARLRVAPRRVHRARSRRGATARIRYRLSARARVMLTFQRRASGVRRSNGCRPAPRRRLPRGTPRCVRWVKVRGSLHQSRPAGSGAVRFGGWVGRRRLAPGRYRVRAVALGSNRMRSIARTAGFSVR